MSDSVLIALIISGGVLLAAFMWFLTSQQRAARANGGGEIGALVIRGYELRLKELMQANNELKVELETIRADFDRYRRDTQKIVLELQLEINRLKAKRPASHTGSYKNVDTGAAIFDLMTERMSDGEILDVAFSLGIDDGYIDRTNKNALARTLIGRADDRRRLPELINRLREVRPDVSWPNFVT